MTRFAISRWTLLLISRSISSIAARTSDIFHSPRLRRLNDFRFLNAKTFPGSSPTISLAGTRPSEQPIRGVLLHESGEELRIFVVDSTQLRPVAYEGYHRKLQFDHRGFHASALSGVSSPAQSDALTILSSIVPSMTDFFLRMTYSDFSPVAAAPV